MKRWPRPDFMAGAPRPPLAGWLFALSGLAALLFASSSAWSVHTEFQRQTQASADSARARPTPRVRGNDPLPASEGDADARRAARRLSAALSHPWGAVLASLEASTPADVQWLSFDHSLDSGEIRLEGQAANASTALRVVDSFGARPGWRDSTLVRLQRTEARDAGAPGGLRFAIEAGLDPAALAAAADPGAP